ncbi:hypothetical protein GQ600_22813 [Phytophthora cactorum]|nr:hypothetical protein GQ600_22813 [Phytophthora cactorum]
MLYVCDHASVNGALASKTDVPMIATDCNVPFFSPCDANQWVIQKVHSLMMRINTLKKNGVHYVKLGHGKYHNAVEQ